MEDSKEEIEDKIERLLKKQSRNGWTQQDSDEYKRLNLQLGKTVYVNLIGW